MDRQPGIHTYPLLQQNTIPQQVQAITPTREQDCIILQAQNHEAIHLHASTMPQTSHIQQRNQILTNFSTNLMPTIESILYST